MKTRASINDMPKVTLDSIADVEVYTVEGGMDQWVKEMGSKLIVS